MKFSIKDFFSKCDQIRSFLCIWSHLLKKSLMESFIFCAVFVRAFDSNQKKLNKLFQIKDRLANYLVPWCGVNHYFIQKRPNISFAKVQILFMVYYRSELVRASSNSNGWEKGLTHLCRSTISQK